MNRPTLGLALSGGTAKSMAHIGVLKALEEAGLRPDYLAGTSGGAIVAALYAAGIGVERLARIGSGVRWKHLARPAFPRLGLLNNEGVASFIEEHLGGKRFEDLDIPLRIVATDLLSGNRVVLDSGSVGRAAMASSSIPNVFQPVPWNGTLLVDGGLVEYLPVETVLEFRPDVAAAVNLGYRGEPSPPPRNLLDVSMAVIGIAAQYNFRISEAKADVVIRPPTQRFPSFDLMATAELIDVGYRAALERIGDLRAALDRARPARNRRFRWWARDEEP